MSLNTSRESHTPSHEDRMYPDEQRLSSPVHMDADNPHSTTSGAPLHTPLLDIPCENDDGGANNNDDSGDDADDSDNDRVTDSDRKSFARLPDWFGTLLNKRSGSRQASCGRAYRPWSLRRDFLFGLSVILVAMIIVLESLLHTSQKNEGLVTSYENERFLWKYGPTARKYQIVHTII